MHEEYPITPSPGCRQCELLRNELRRVEELNENLREQANDLEEVAEERRFDRASVLVAFLLGGSFGTILGAALFCLWVALAK